MSCEAVSNNACPPVGVDKQSHPLDQDSVQGVRSRRGRGLRSKRLERCGGPMAGTLQMLATRCAPRAIRALNGLRRMTSLGVEEEELPSDVVPPQFAPPPSVARHSGQTVFSEFTALAQAQGAINLGQGAPGWNPPGFAIAAMRKALEGSNNQYCRAMGHPALCNQLASIYTESLGRKIDPMTEVTITVGATGGIFTTMQALVEHGDEVVVFEPNYDSYVPSVEYLGGKVQRVPLKAPKTIDERFGPLARSVEGAFQIDFDALESVLSNRTRAIIVNNPHNPSGRCLSQDDVKRLAQLVSEVNGGDSAPRILPPPGATFSRETGSMPRPVRDRGGLMVVCDEVYDQLVMERSGGVEVSGEAPRHHSIASVPGLEDHTIVIGSAGKTLSCTGWKIGWAIGPAPAIGSIASVNQWTQFCVSTPTQVAVAEALQAAQSQPYQGHDNFLDWTRHDYQTKRDALTRALTNAGLGAWIPDAGFFTLADTSKWVPHIPQRYFEEPSSARAAHKLGISHDWALCRWLTTEAKVAAIPPSAFYAFETEPQAATLARFAFCKTVEDIEEAGHRLERFASKLASVN
jgi:aspartate/methionine/tyrosine aminotransferase